MPPVGASGSGASSGGPAGDRPSIFNEPSSATPVALSPQTNSTSLSPRVAVHSPRAKTIVHSPPSSPKIRAKMLEVANERSPRGGKFTPMSAAALYGNAGMIRQLLAHGVDPRGLSPASVILQDDEDKWPAIYFAMVEIFEDSRPRRVGH